MYFSFLCVFFGYFCQWLLIFACHPFLFWLNYLDHTHILYSNILILTLNTMAKPYLAKLHLTCANDHDSVRVCHWTIANHSLLWQMHWLLLYCVNDTLLGHAMSCLKISLSPTCTHLFMGIIGYLSQWLLIFACQSFSFWLNYLDHTHFLTATFESWHWTQWQNLIRKNYT